MRTSLIFILLFGILTCGCDSQDKETSRIRGFDISQDDTNIIYSYNNETNQSSIRRYNLLNKSDSVLLSSTKGIHFSNPKYSPDESKIIFIEYNSNNLKTSSLCISDYNGANKEYLVKEKGIITEAVFSLEKDEIYFLMADNYESYSPVGIKNYHNFDIYSFDIINKKITKLSNLDSYNLSQLSIIDKNDFFISKYEGSSGGMFKFSRNLPEELDKIVPSNDPRGDSSLYYSPKFSKTYDIIAFIAPYQIYTMNRDTKIAELLFDNRGAEHIDNISFYNTEMKILFVKANQPYFYSIDLNSLEVSRL